MLRPVRLLRALPGLQDLVVRHRCLPSLRRNHGHAQSVHGVSSDVGTNGSSSKARDAADQRFVASFSLVCRELSLLAYTETTHSRQWGDDTCEMMCP